MNRVNGFKKEGGDVPHPEIKINSYPFFYTLDWSFSALPRSKFISHTLSHITFLILLAAATFRLDDITYPIGNTEDNIFLHLYGKRYCGIFVIESLSLSFLSPTTYLSPSNMYRSNSIFFSLQIQSTRFKT